MADSTNGITAPTLKPGWKTTEFWLSIATVGLLTLDKIVPALHDTPARAECYVFIAVGFAITRGIAKHGTASSIGTDVLTAILTANAAQQTAVPVIGASDPETTVPVPLVNRIAGQIDQAMGNVKASD